MLQPKKNGGVGRDSWKQDGEVLTTVEPEQNLYVGYIILPLSFLFTIFHKNV